MELEEVVSETYKTPEAMALLNVAEIREKIRALGPRPDPQEVEDARQALAASNASLAQALESIALEDLEAKAEEEKAARDAAERERLPLRAILQLDELHRLYGNLLKDAEALLEKNSSVPVKEEGQGQNLAASRLLDEAAEKKLSELNLCNQSLQLVPESIGRISSLVDLNLSTNQVEVLPDAIAGLANLERLQVQSNRLRILPDSIGLMKNLKYLNCSRNQLKQLPESISGCSALIELNADFNKLEYLPSRFGRGMDSLERLSLQLNSLTYLPPTLCEAQTLKHLDLHFNKLRSLPRAIGNLTRLETLDASSNFSDLTALPESMADLVSLTHLDLRYNQIRELPLSFGRLTNIKTLELDENPLVDPPLEIVQQGTPATMKYLAYRLEASLLKAIEEEKLRSSQQPSSPSWIPAAAQGWVSGVYSNISSYLTSPKASGKEDYLEQQL
ncbi:plant intracellular Ras-group-related LRR protein 1 [Selaginella moellendorffii]|uniref:plant intracellular Ras-group-related LRR protein 1 n=1 Tax=Selaginella moellendorffii TaxID=88036 RepID=UPI000D1C3E44|nr:plant intracellular Ras-group-related LRR protein 1 [Selaginella moellendorffii]|eukprot:XP_024544494.1 plant intracellular Ras-group-related LRR protein 1 [Selaginella moellendorffii]